MIFVFVIQNVFANFYTNFIAKRHSLINRVIQGRWGKSPPQQLNICSSPHLEEFPNYPPVDSPRPIFSYSHCSCTVFILISCSFNTQVMLILILIDLQYSQKAAFSFEKGLNGQNHSP